MIRNELSVYFLISACSEGLGAASSDEIGEQRPLWATASGQGSQDGFNGVMGNDIGCETNRR